MQGRQIYIQSICFRRTKCYPFHDGSDWIESTCHWVAGQSPKRIVPCRDSALVSGRLSTQQWPGQPGRAETHVADPMYNPHPWHFDPLDNGRSPEERAWLVATEWVMLSTRLLKFSSTQVTLWWVLIWGTNILIFFAHSEESTVYLFPRPCCHQFSSDVSNHPTKPFSIVPELV